MIFKGYGDGRDGNGAKIFASLFNLWFYKPVSAFSIFLLAYAYHVVFQFMKKYSSLGVTVVFLIYIDKLFCSNSDINKR